jgi:hypothetical protein
VRESAEAKGRRYVPEGRLLVQGLDPREIVVVCRGNGAIYWVGYQRGGWGTATARASGDARTSSPCNLLP